MNNVFLEIGKDLGAYDNLAINWWWSMILKHLQHDIEFYLSFLQGAEKRAIDMLDLPQVGCFPMHQFNFEAEKLIAMIACSKYTANHFIHITAWETKYINAGDDIELVELTQNGESSDIINSHIPWHGVKIDAEIPNMTDSYLRLINWVWLKGMNGLVDLVDAREQLHGVNLQLVEFHNSL